MGKPNQGKPGLWITGVKKELKDKIAAIADAKDTSMSTLIRPYLRKLVEDNKEFLTLQEPKNEIIS